MTNAITRRPAILLDRDGTIIVEKNYLCDPDQVEIEAGAVAGLRRLAEAGFVLAVVSNQSGIGRGYFSVAAADAVNRRVDEILRAGGVEIAGWYMCVHGPAERCACRKPLPGLALKAAAELDLDLSRSFVIGDKRSDVELAHTFGGVGLLVASGHGAQDAAWARARAVPVCETLEDAAQVIEGLLHAPAPSLADLEGMARDWIVNLALPLWSTLGHDPATGRFEERLSFGHTPDPDAPQRLMVQARQISVFARAALEGDFPQGAALARRAGAAMIRDYLEADGAAGWVFSIDRLGRVVDGTRDLYAHAFALFALAWLKRLGSDAPVDAAIARTLAFLDDAFADGRAGGYWDSLPRKDALRRQNPHMHLFEALIELAEVSPTPDLLARCAALDDLARTRFLSWPDCALREVFHDDWSVAPAPGQGSVEPGHQMEWAWLWGKYAALSGVDRRDLASGLVARALETGIDHATGRIVDECGEDGAVRKHSSRSWPHAEALKALATEISHGRRDRLDVYTRIYRRLLRAYCVPELGGGWIDQRDEHDVGISDAMPASSLYHIYFGLKSITAVLESGEAG